LDVVGILGSMLEKGRAASAWTVEPWFAPPSFEW
jgi:hypothetical protein